MTTPGEHIKKADEMLAAEGKVADSSLTYLAAIAHAAVAFVKLAEEEAQRTRRRTGTSSG